MIMKFRHMNEINIIILNTETKTFCSRLKYASCIHFVYLKETKDRYSNSLNMQPNRLLLFVCTLIYFLFSLKMTATEI